MNLARRICVALLSGLVGVSPLASGQSASVREVAITIDDPDLNAADTPLLSLDRRDEAIRQALRREQLQAAIFVCGMRVDRPKGREHLLAWNRAGHLIGNHSYSHLYFPRAGFEQFSADVLRGESVIANLPQFRRLFRFPYLKEGATREQRDQMRAFLAAHGYRQGYVTIDTSDWAIDARLRKRLDRDSKANLDTYRQFYLDHIWARASYYDRLATEVLERPVKHTLLLHHNLLINASEALSDPVFSATPDIVPAGESIIWQIAKETGRFDGELRYPAEDAVYEEPKMNALGL